MQPWVAPYELTVFAMAATAALFLIQLLVLDLAGIKSRHVPGTPVQADHANFLFRASRAHANTNESIGAFVILAVVAILSSASAAWANNCAWLYVAGRVGHMLCYYADLRLARSVSFAVSLLALFLMLAAVLSALFRVAL